jgi:hypothetical protein
MTAATIAGLLLIGVSVAFNSAFALLVRALRNCERTALP